MQTEKSQPESKPEMKFTEFSALSVDPRTGISRSASETDDRIYFFSKFGKIVVFIHFYVFLDTNFEVFRYGS